VIVEAIETKAKIIVGIASLNFKEYGRNLRPRLTTLKQDSICSINLLKEAQRLTDAASNT
jgi:hypothetical protein